MTFTPSERWLVIVALGFLNWLLIFLISLCLLPIEFESYVAARIAYAIVIVAVSGPCACAYLRQSFVARRREGVIAGVWWTAIALAMDVPARWVIEGVKLKAYLTDWAPYLLLVLLVCGAVGFLLRYVEVRRATTQLRGIPPFRRR